VRRKDSGDGSQGKAKFVSCLRETRMKQRSVRRISISDGVVSFTLDEKLSVVTHIIPPLDF